MSIARIVKLYHSGKTLREVADTLGISHQTVGNNLREAGVKRRRPGNDSKVTKSDLLAAMESARTRGEVAKLVRFADGRSARKRARDLGIDWESEGNLARYRHLAVDMYRCGHSLCQIAEIVGRNSNAVYSVLKRLGEIDPGRANPYHFSKRFKRDAKPVSATAAARWSKVGGRRAREGRN